MLKRSNLKHITFKKSESLFRKERIVPVTLYLKTTFSPVALYKKSDKSDKSDKSKRATRATRAKRAKERQERQGRKEQKSKERKSEFPTLNILYLTTVINRMKYEQSHLELNSLWTNHSMKLNFQLWFQFCLLFKKDIFSLFGSTFYRFQKNCIRKMFAITVLSALHMDRFLN